MGTRWPAILVVVVAAALIVVGRVGKRLPVALAGYALLAVALVLAVFVFGRR